MTKITIGKILQGREERELLRAALTPIRWRGYQIGNYAVELSEGVLVRIALSSRDVSVLEQLDELVEAIASANRQRLVGYTGGYDEDEQEEVVWMALGPVRSVGYGDGEYTVKLPGGYEIEYRVDRWQAMLLRRYDELLGRLLQRNAEFFGGNGGEIVESRGLTAAAA